MVDFLYLPQSKEIGLFSLDSYDPCKVSAKQSWPQNLDDELLGSDTKYQKKVVVNRRILTPVPNLQGGAALQFRVCSVVVLPCYTAVASCCVQRRLRNAVF